ncbi:heme O synthase-like polyprenyltransferase [Scopulibacillus daqui]|uniref:Heme O synthase-like polyprenyltransferase n=2 Tax=Scopulibacillus daqui TaxID=1469162 RepID=A0ABS2PWP6_9BACL|nr:heme O synthase-like polyprenyltransferase [Scopulibacillus daqui]
MILKSIMAAVIAGILFTFISGLYSKSKHKKINPSNIFFQGILFAVVLFVLFFIERPFK